MSKPKQWKQGRELKHYDVYSGRERDRQEDRKPEYWGATSGNGYAQTELQSCVVDGRLQLNDAYPQEAEQPDRLWVGSGDAS